MDELAVPVVPDTWWDDLRVGSHWRTRARTITEPDLVAWLNLTWLTEELFTNLDDRSGSAIAGRFVPGALVYSFAEGLTLGAVGIHGMAFLHADVDVKRPTFVGDTIHVRSTVEELRATTKTDRGLCRTRNEVVNQRGEPVQVYTALRMIRRRPA
jgi:acyl dehydratase